MDWVSLFRLPQHNPLFAHGLRRMRRIRSIDGLRHYTRRTLAVLVVLALIFVGLAFVGMYDSYRQYGYTFNAAEPFAIVGGGVIYVTLYTSFVPDFVTLLFSVGLINIERNEGRYELTRLSLGESGVVYGQHALGVLRAWRVAAVWTLARFVGTALLLIAGVLALLQVNWESDIAYDEIGLAVATLIIWGIVGIGLLLFAWIEPFLRLRMSVAAGVFTSARSQNVAMGTLYATMLIGATYSGLGMVTAVPVSIVLGFLFGGMLYGESIGATLTDEQLYILFGLVLGPLFAVAMTGGLYVFYRVMTHTFLHSTVTYLQRQD